MDCETAQAQLVDAWREIRHLESASQLLEWDQETYMPEAGVAGRADVLATLAGLRHDRLTSPELSDAVAAVAETAEDDVWLAQASEARRRIDRAVCVPRRLAAEIAAASSAALASWQEARHQRSFAPFAADLERLVALKREESQAVSGGKDPYDALLDEYEPGVREADLVPLFASLRRELVPLVQAISECGRVVDETPARGHFPLEKQRLLGAWAAERIGFDFKAGRLDSAAHPFCVGIHHLDVRLTWRGDEADFRPALFGILHEAGHGLYEQGLPTTWEGTPLGEAASTGLHESQSRLWENLVGRSEAFWRWFLPRFREVFPAHSLDLEGIWPALHAVRPSLVRVEADEVTYHLHVFARFELERRLFSGDLKVAEIPSAWDDLYLELLGLCPPDPVSGALQDIHWACGLFGYFPTYTLGTLMSCQLFAAASSELGDLDSALGQGDFNSLLAWLRRQVHSHGCRFRANEILRAACGEDLTSAAYLGYVRGLCQRVYDVVVESI